MASLLAASLPHPNCSDCSDTLCTSNVLAPLSFHCGMNLAQRRPEWLRWTFCVPSLGAERFPPRIWVQEQNAECGLIAQQAEESSTRGSRLYGATRIRIQPQMRPYTWEHSRRRQASYYPGLPGCAMSETQDQSWCMRPYWQFGRTYLAGGSVTSAFLLHSDVL